MADHATPRRPAQPRLDIVGTGGDGYKTVNVSTMSAIVLAAMGIPLVKHGNRASTSQSGSADVIEALGGQPGTSIPSACVLSSRRWASPSSSPTRCIPSMRFAAPRAPRPRLPDAFNVLGPLTNPAKVRACAVGSAKEDNARLMAGVYASRGCSALVFRGATTGLGRADDRGHEPGLDRVGWPGDAHRFRRARRARHGSGRDR